MSESRARDGGSDERRHDVSDSLSFEDVRWTTCSVADFADLYRERVVPRLEAAGRDPTTERPTHEWFERRGARSFLAALRRHHGRSFGTFWREDLGFGEGDGGYSWATAHGETINALERFLDRRRSRYDLAQSSLEALRTRLNLYVRAYGAANESDDLLAPVRRDGDVPEYEAVDGCYAAFDWLNESATREYSARTLRRVRRVVDAWYEHLVGRRVASVNPATGLYDEFKWEIADSPTPSLSADHVRALASAASTPRDRLLVTALAAWGLRASEVASLHVSQFERPAAGEGNDDDVPVVAFESRKNGPGEVSVLFGEDAVDARIDELTADEEWTGFMFPSVRGETPHVTRDTVRNWFRALADDAGLPDEIGGERPSPQLCRRFWYDTYSAVLEGVLDGVEEIAGEQGSDDPRVVMQNYLSASRSRQLRRAFMREQLAAAFDAPE